MKAVTKRNGLEWAATEARRAIHDNDLERLQQLLAEYPALLSWRSDVVIEEGSESGLLGIATSAFGDAGDAQREQWFTRGACAELLIDAGAVVMPDVFESLLQSRAKGLLELFHRKSLLPHTLKFLAALGDRDGVRAALDGNGNDLKAVNEAFVSACRFAREAVASVLLERSVALDPEFGVHIAGTDRTSFTKAFEKGDFAKVAEYGLWRVFVMEQVTRTVVDGDLPAFAAGLQHEPWLLGDAYVTFQARLIDLASFSTDRGKFIRALLDLDPAILRCQPPPRVPAIQQAFVFANTHLLPLLTRIWPVPDDLPHAAGMGDLTRVQHWFDESGAPALGDLSNHFPGNDSHARGMLQWGAPNTQQILDTALAWAVINRHFDVADFLLEHGADINTDWSSHEPASILHHLVFLPNPYESMRFLIDRGIDMTIKDYRWDSNAVGWARYGKSDEQMARWLEDAEGQRKQ